VPDLLLVESPPLFIGYAARFLARRWNVGYVFNVSDLWPDSAVDMGIVGNDTIAVRMARKLERAVYREAVGVTGQTDDIVATVRERTNGTPIEVITNSVDPTRFGRNRADEQALDLVGREPGPIFMYAGLLGLAQGLDQILDAAAALPAELPGRFVLVGDGPVRRHLEQRVMREQLSRVRLLPAQPRERIPALLALADIALITLGGDIRGAVPNKIYEAMASSLPIIIVAQGEAARRVENAGAGIAVPPQTPVALREACRRMIEDATLRMRCGAAGRASAETIYNRDHIAARLDNFLRARLDASGSGE
jgi:glycosyltransferase involved in cell wall biosynthesis